MADTKIDKKRIWLDFAKDATSRYIVPDEIEDTDELANDMADVATAYADLMLEEFEDREEDGTFKGGGEQRTSRRRRREEPEGEREDD
jgi:hypothetical protein